MKKRIWRLLYIPSATALLFGLSRIVRCNANLFLALGAVTGAAVCFLGKGQDKGTKRTFGYIFALLVSVLLTVNLYGAYFKDPEYFKLITELSGGNRGIVAAAITAVGIVSYPFTACFTVFAVNLICSCVKCVDTKKLQQVIKRGMSAKNLAGKILIAVLCIILSAALGIAALTAVYSLPIEPIVNNVAKSASIIATEDIYPDVYGWCASTLDNFTDSLILLEASDISDESPFKQALTVSHGVIGNPAYTLTQHFTEDEDFIQKEQYTRYWHGYQIFIKPLLSVTDYAGIRVINTIVQLTLAALILLLFRKRAGTLYAAGFLIVYLLLAPSVLWRSLQYSTCFYLLSLTILALLVTRQERLSRLAWFVFLCSGILTAYFDYLTYPSAVYGMAAVTYLALCRDDSPENRLCDSVGNGIWWCLGYGGMWVSKWMIAKIALDYNISADAIQAVAVRTSSLYEYGEGTYSRLYCELQNQILFLCTPFSMLMTVFAVFLLWYCIRHRKSNLNSAAYIIVPYLVPALVPILWYAALTNHSSLHVFFTNKTFSTAVFAFLIVLSELSSERTGDDRHQNGIMHDLSV